MERKIDTLKANKILTITNAVKDLGVNPDDLAIDEQNVLHLTKAMVRVPDEAERLAESERQKIVQLAEQIRHSGSILTNPFTKWRELSPVTQPAAVDFITDAVALNQIFHDNGLGRAEIVLPSGIEGIECHEAGSHRRTDFVFDYCQDLGDLTMRNRIWHPPESLPLTQTIISPRTKKISEFYGFFMTLCHPNGGVPHRHQVIWSQIK